MKIFVCDICKLNVKEYNLRTLYKDMQPEDIKDVCEDCYRAIHNALGRIEKALEPLKKSWIKRIILRLKAAKQ